MIKFWVKPQKYIEILKKHFSNQTFFYKSTCVLFTKFTNFFVQKKIFYLLQKKNHLCLTKKIKYKTVISC